MCVKQTCTKNPTRSKITIPPLENPVPRRNIVHHRPPLPPWQRRKKRGTAIIPRSGRAPLHTRMLLELMNRAVASDGTETLWHVGRGSSPWSPDPNAANFIRRSRRRGTSSLAIIHVPNCPESADRQPPDMNLAGSGDRRDDRATCPPTSPDGAASR
jgi:hypothetical protein